jgi:CheY-like chemotaxis protein
VLTVDLPGDPLMVDADAGRLVQVFGNLLHNAAKYTDPGGAIRVEAGSDARHAWVRVADDGAGIPAAMLDAIFDMFTQVDTSIGRTHGGLGIGLTLVRKLVELHGGTIEARSEGEGRGSEFTVRLPAATPCAKTQASAPRAQPLPGIAPRRVLVVDDVEPSADTFALLLGSLGQVPMAVYDGASAVRAIEEFRPDVAFVDIAMPGMDGFEVVRRVRERCPVPPVLVALTGYGQDHDRRRALSAGFDHHLVKPASLAQVHGLLATLQTS